MIPVNSGTNSQTRLTKKPSGSPDVTARTSVAAYMATSTGTCRTSAAPTSRPKSVTSFTRGSTAWSRPGCAATSSENIAWRITSRRAADRLLDEAALAALADAPARAQTDLGLHQPVGRRGAPDVMRSRPGARRDARRANGARAA